MRTDSLRAKRLEKTSPGDCVLESPQGKMDGQMGDRNVPATWACKCTSTSPRCYRWKTRTFLTTVTCCLVMLVLCQPQSAMAMKPRHRFMEYHCSDTVNVYTGMLLALKPSHLLPDERSTAWHNHMSCQVVLRAPLGSRILLHFLWLQISPNKGHHDRVKIFDKFTWQGERTPKGGIYGKLDRPLGIQDQQGSKVQDYRSSRNEIKIDYQGIPTTQHPGFKILVTVYQSPDSSGQCPSDHFRCPVENGLCVPYSVACDGFNNCGDNDNGDEKNCDSFETVTDLVENYSLMYDIIVMVCLPVLVFITVALTALCCMRRYIKLKITIQAEPPVRYSSANGGKVRVKLTDEKAMARLYAPPSYEDVVNPSRMAPPPAYNTLSDRIKSGEIEIIDSEDEMCSSSPRGQRRLAKHRQERLSRGGACTDSLSSLEEKPSPCSARARRHELSPGPYKGAYKAHRQRDKSHKSYGVLVKPSDTDDDDDERERKNRKKGGKGKKTVCAKRRADDVIGDVCEIYVNVSEESSSLIRSNECHSLNRHLPTNVTTLHSTLLSSESPHAPSVSHPPSACNSHSSPTASKSCMPLHGLPPPPSYSQAGGDRPPLYKPRGPHASRLDTVNITKPKPGETTLALTSETSVPPGNQILPCVVETNLSSSRSSTPNSSPTGGQAVPNTHSPSPSSCSNGDQDQASHSETESRPPSNTNSRTESNGSLAEHCVNIAKIGRAHV